MLRPPRSPLFPYTTLFRSTLEPTRESAMAGECPIGCPKNALAQWLTEVAGSRICAPPRSEEHTSELQSRQYLVCRLLLEKKKNEASEYDRHELADVVLNGV